MFNVYLQKCDQSKAELYGKTETEGIAVSMIKNCGFIPPNFKQMKWSSVGGRLFPFCEVFLQGSQTMKFFVEEVSL